MGTSYQSHAQSIDKEKLLQFEEAITRGEEFLQVKDYAKAKAEYQKALAIDPTSRYPKDKLAQIRKVYIDPKDETDFAEAVAAGDRLAASGSYREAKARYEAALLIKPEDRAVREKLANVDKLDVEKSQRLKEYETLITTADKDLSEKNYEAAKPKYERAALLNTEDTYAKKKIKEIDAILAAQKALDDSYNTEINLADEAYMNRDFAVAKVKYQQAARLKPLENYPNSMLERVNESIKTQATNAIANEAELKKRQEEEAKLALLRAEEEAIIAQQRAEEEAKQKATRETEEIAARQVEEKRLADSLKLAEETAANHAALAAKTQAEELRLAKLAEEKRIADSLQFAKENAENQATLAAQTQAEELRLAKLAEEKRVSDSIQLVQATAAQKALLEEQLAQSKAEELRLAELAELKAKADAVRDEELRAQENLKAEQLSAQENLKAEQLREQEALAETTRIEEERKRQLEYERTTLADREYNEAIETGNRLYTEEDYPSAMKMFERAVELKPMEDYPRDRLIQINNIVLERMKNNLDAYNKFVAAGDLAYQTNVFDRALEEFEKALTMRPEESYPTLMTSKIKKLMEDNSIVGLVTEPIIILNGYEQRFRFDPIDMRLRKNNYILIKARRTTEYTPKVFINYGKDGMKSGGIVMKGIETEETVDYLLRISVQDKWYRIDNNYITIYPEGGDLEISSMHISQGDIQPVVLQQEQ